ncbi:Dehydrodolichyl diphosphate synthase complex subunit DHDDS [Chionoecetes opilio]|uniref:Alkyl transferase n=1 Tax=Chionoecetes opilio TaxID=41210 RepID=A0A8J8WEW1_CHIOP|nr:Dehydrodolichyl diphosphate synthase complex subunit DHDDS [Chionoecetes opilio]
MTWVVEQKRSWAEWMALRVLWVGPIPTHLAIIMDGNRRYARREQREPLAGHTQGFHKLAEVLCWCRDLGIRHVTAYAFSIENFKRSKSEVDGLMELAAEKLSKILEEKDKLAEHGVCINVLGDLSLLPSSIQRMAAQAMLATRHNSCFFLNLAIAYTGREEITSAVQELVWGVAEDWLQSSDVNEGLLEACLYGSGNQEPDLLLRTSGEQRLSDFLLWQSAFSCLFFTQVLWPDFSIWHLFGAVFFYQRQYHTLTAARREALAQRCRTLEERDLEQCRLQHGDKVTYEHLAAQAAARTARLQAFMDYRKQRQLASLYQLASLTVGEQEGRGREVR